MNRFASVCFLLLLVLSACGTLEITVDRTPTPDLGATATLGALQDQNAQLATQIAVLNPPTGTPTVMPPPQPTPQDTLGGGTIFDGPFMFDVRLIRDPTLNQHPVATSLYSDLYGVGAWMYWYYTGADVIGPVKTYWGTLPQLNHLLQDYPSIQLGNSGGRNGGIMLPGGLFVPGKSKPGDRVRVALKVVTPDSEYGAVISFTLQQGLNGFEPTDISEDVLSEQILNSAALIPTARLTGPAAAYTDPVIGYAINYPEGWYVQAEPGWVTVISSFPPKQDGTGGLRSDQAKINLTPTKPYECVSLQQLKTNAYGGEGEIIWEQQWRLSGDTPAVRMQSISEAAGTSAILLTVINGRCLNVAGYGDLSLFDAIADSLRPLP